MSHKKGKDDSNMVLHVFDAMHFDEWHNQVAESPMKDRVELVKELVGQLPKDAPVKQVMGLTVVSEAELMKFYSESMEAGYEGIMLKDLDSPYLFKRSDNIRKMKPVATTEGVIVGHYEGRRGSKREGLWGGFEVVLPNGVVTRLGGGFTDKLKSEVQLAPDDYLGKIVEVEGQPDPLTGDGLTKDGRVRFPVFCRFRDESDVDPKVTSAGKNFVKSVKMLS
jgi:ATP-dependent DNA ligase